MSYDSKCYDLAVHFFGEKDPRLQEIAQEIQDAVESFPSDHDGDIALQRLRSKQPAETPVKHEPKIRHHDMECHCSCGGPWPCPETEGKQS